MAVERSHTFPQEKSRKGGWSQGKLEAGRMQISRNVRTSEASWHNVSCFPPGSVLLLAFVEDETDLHRVLNGELAYDYLHIARVVFLRHGSTSVLLRICTFG